MALKEKILAKILGLLAFSAIVVIMTASQLHKMNPHYTVKNTVINNDLSFTNGKKTDCLAKTVMHKWPELKVEVLEAILKNPLTRQMFESQFLKQKETFHEMKTDKGQNDQTNNVQKLKEANYSDISPSDDNKQNPLPTKTESRLERFLSKPIINPFVTTYRYNHPRMHCPKGTNLLIAMPSAPGNFARRKLARKSNSSDYTRNPKNRAKMVFFLGSFRPSPENKKLQERIDREYILHEDIVQATFVDEYHNITKKSSLMLHWASTYCKEAKFFLRVDDDVSTRIEPLVRALEIKSWTFDVFILGNMKPFDYPVKNPKSIYVKYLVPDSQWPRYKPFPPFVLGGAYGFPMKVARLLLEGIRRTKFLWLDDVFVTGVSANNVGVPVFHDFRFKFHHSEDKHKP